MMNTHLPLIAVGSIGGTISMTRQSGEIGVKPRLGALELAASVPGLASAARLKAESLLSVASAHLTFADLQQCLTWARRQVREGADGVVLTQGTDSIEETAFFLDLFWDLDAPLFITGAMRAPQSAGADGPANLLGAVKAAAAAESRGRGVQVLMNDQILPALWAEKTHSTSCSAFSAQQGPAGEILEGSAVYFSAPAGRSTMPDPERFGRVLIWQHALSETPDALSCLFEQNLFDGLVLSGFGSGHVNPQMAAQLADIAKLKPVVMCTRAARGSTTYATYGYEGGEIDLQGKGILMAGRLRPLKARILLSVLLGQSRDPLAAFQAYAAAAGQGSVLGR